MNQSCVMLRLIAIIVIAIMALCVGWHLVAAMLVVIAFVIAIFSTAFSHSSEERQPSKPHRYSREERRMAEKFEAKRRSEENLRRQERYRRKRYEREQRLLNPLNCYTDPDDPDPNAEGYY
ncbi:hypothetical protein [uncultured Prevotella sp.]|uniref:hypothetical protein n=1 Tax=uncultured Prevotella sp. TaxID=159272 RepID=UPI00258346AE|nr:hypothetical protein [uncultured Prevotella sp.]